MQLLFATTNPAKIAQYRQPLAAHDIELITLADLDFRLNVEESGQTATDNAHIKARAYYDATHLPTLGMDNCLYIEELPAALQPDTHVHRINGRELNDDEMISYYTDLVAQYGGRLTAAWHYSLAIHSDAGSADFSWQTKPFYLISRPSPLRRPGYPLDSISISPELNQYFTELPDTDSTLSKTPRTTDDIIQFILGHLQPSD